MSYIRTILRPDEKLLATGYIHWIVYWPAIALMALAVISLFVLGSSSIAARIIFVLLALAAVFFAIKEWFQQWITEIAVTDRRVIVKTGLIRRHTAEMNMDKVESVTVYQPVLGRLLDFGSVQVRGTGEGLGHLDYIKSPILLRNTITAK
jgi:uncharacterized membrane protein YdbT with pleckstrin-like domain